MKKILCEILLKENFDNLRFDAVLASYDYRERIFIDINFCFKVEIVLTSNAILNLENISKIKKVLRECIIEKQENATNHYPISILTFAGLTLNGPAAKMLISKCSVSEKNARLNDSRDQIGNLFKCHIGKQNENSNFLRYPHQAVVLVSIHHPNDIFLCHALELSKFCDIGRDIELLKILLDTSIHFTSAFLFSSLGKEENDIEMVSYLNGWFNFFAKNDHETPRILNFCEKLLDACINCNNYLKNPNSFAKFSLINLIYEISFFLLNNAISEQKESDQMKLVHHCWQLTENPIQEVYDFYCYIGTKLRFYYSISTGDEATFKILSLPILLAKNLKAFHDQIGKMLNFNESSSLTFSR